MVINSTPTLLDMGLQGPSDHGANIELGCVCLKIKLCVLFEPQRPKSIHFLSEHNSMITVNGLFNRLTGKFSSMIVMTIVVSGVFI